ncbi:Glucan endo-1,3-alpha-glucosidase agn1 [Paramyrothecium foliicola]|nr:Glucan endo-1,3-alpha-glucosidase agn1 [Paramyrothecium foliicola]
MLNLEANIAKVSNAVNYTQADWANEIKLAQEAHIDAFALNMAYNQGEAPQLKDAFAAASGTGFQLFFSFDYAGNGPWPKEDVVRLLGQYGTHGSHYQYQGRPFVSTFEGPEQAKDWIDIKSRTSCFFVPDWSSLGAKAAMEQADGVADGLFSWAACPWGNRDMDTYVDASYAQYLNGKPYMMPVSPWFYTNLPGFDKNWLWRGDDLWFDRWQEVLYVQPEWVEIVSWNDFGESHHIGPIVNKALGALDRGRAPFDFVSDMPHDAWRKTLPFSIDMYVRNATTITEEGVTFWYRKQPAAACSTGQTSGNTVSQLQLEFSPLEVAQDRVFFTAILASNADVSVSIGGASQAATWSDEPEGGIGLYHGSVPFNGVGEVKITITRNGATVASGAGIAITNQCEAGGLANWNAWVGYAKGPSVSKKPLAMDKRVCVEGNGLGGFSGLCKFSCGLGYCPLGACYCTKMGEQRKYPEQKDVMGYPGPGKDANYAGLCAFACRYGYCPDGACATFQSPLTIPNVSPFSPPACIKGTGPPGYEGLCSYACNFGFCPIGLCTCGEQGALNQPPAIKDNLSGRVNDPKINDFGICKFACSRGYCPEPCVEIKSGGGEDGGELVSIDPKIWKDPNPVASCIPPCVLILPPLTLTKTTTITFPPYTTTLTQSWVKGSSKVTVLVITYPPVTTTRIPVFNVNITASGVNGVDYTITPSLFPTTTTIIGPPPGVTAPSMTLVVTSTPTSSSTWPIISDKDQPTKVRHSSAGPPSPTCTGTGCGEECKAMCNSCGLFGCGGCILGILGCGGCLSPFGCGIDVTGGGCIGPACPATGCVGGGCEPNTECDEPKTVSACTASCSVTLASRGASTFTTDCYTTRCTDSVGCNATPTTTTTRTTSGCPTLGAYVPWWTDVDQDVFGPGDDGWGGYVMSTGTYKDPAKNTKPIDWDDDGGSSTPTEVPKSLPPRSGGLDAVFMVVYWEEGGKGQYRGYELHSKDLQIDMDVCDWEKSGASWTGYPGDPIVPQGTIKDIPVFGDTCTYSPKHLTCGKWKDASCQVLTGGFGSPMWTGKCGKSSWGSIMACHWFMA